MRYFCRVAYDGTRYRGWQVQPDAPSIQQYLEEKAAIVLRHPVAVTGAGRTDAGVHAEAQGAHFDTEEEIDCYRFTGSMNALLPDDIALFSVQRVTDSFHARYSARRRSYRYRICFRKQPLLVNRAWHVKYEVDWGVIMTQLPALLGRHDFTPFRASGSGSATADCTVFSAAIERGDDTVVFSIEADRFVYKMVRSIVGTLIDIGRGMQTLTLKEILERGDRRLAGTTAPPSGLILASVGYEEV
jgi:tRNA pseudouridine38-40 synthase